MLLISFGTRPEYIKIKPLLEVINGIIPYKLCFTGQHPDLLAKVKADYILKIEDGENRLNSITISILKYSYIFQDINYVLVMGDTTTAYAVALSAFHHQIPVIHLEAGLRTYNLQSPYPEEFNRQIISKIATINFCPTKLNASNLENEKCNGKIYITGNTGLDNLISYQKDISYNNEILITLHRRENHSTINQWFQVINELAKEYNDLQFTLPIHPNPNVQKYKSILTKVNIVDPLSYDIMIDKIVSCKFIISDSGGLQEEASFLKKKIIVCRNTTERPESLNTTSFLCPNPNQLKNLFKDIYNNYIPVNHTCPYGDGFAAKKILDILVKSNFRS